MKTPLKFDQQIKEAPVNQLQTKQQTSRKVFPAFEDSRTEATAQRKLQKKADKSLVSQRAIQLQKKANQFSAKQAIQKQENKTGLPDNLKSGIENLSGYSMNDVRVHYNSDKPAELNAHAYAQGTDIHLASGQEKHLPHEAWHVVQQKQGRVKPTMQMKEKVNINDDQGLEREADMMGAKAMQMKYAPNSASEKDSKLNANSKNRNTTIQSKSPVQLIKYKNTWRGREGNWKTFLGYWVDEKAENKWRDIEKALNAVKELFDSKKAEINSQEKIAEIQARINKLDSETIAYSEADSTLKQIQDIKAEIEKLIAKKGKETTKDQENTITVNHNNPPAEEKENKIKDLEEVEEKGRGHLMEEAVIGFEELGRASTEIREKDERSEIEKKQKEDLQRIQTENAGVAAFIKNHLKTSPDKVSDHKKEIIRRCLYHPKSIFKENEEDLIVKYLDLGAHISSSKTTNVVGEQHNQYPTVIDMIREHSITGAIHERFKESMPFDSKVARKDKKLVDIGNEVTAINSKAKEKSNLGEDVGAGESILGFAAFGGSYIVEQYDQFIQASTDAEKEKYCSNLKNFFKRQLRTTLLVAIKYVYGQGADFRKAQLEEDKLDDKDYLENNANEKAKLIQELLYEIIKLPGNYKNLTSYINNVTIGQKSQQPLSLLSEPYTHLSAKAAKDLKRDTDWEILKFRDQSMMHIIERGIQKGVKLLGYGRTHVETVKHYKDRIDGHQNLKVYLETIDFIKDV